MSEKQMFTVLAAELTRLGFDTSAVERQSLGPKGWATVGYGLKIAGHPFFRSPEVRGERYVWAGTSFRKASTLAERIAEFLKGAS